MTYDSLWLGAWDGLTEGIFQWWATGSDVTYTNWQVGKPSDKTYLNCAKMNLTDGKWADKACIVPSNTTLTYCETEAPRSSKFKVA